MFKCRKLLASWIVPFALMCALFSSCRSGQEVVVSTSEKTTAIRIDTIQTHDTIAIETHSTDSVVIRAVGDTIYVEKWHDRVHYRDRAIASSSVKIIRDTVSKTDTIKAIREVPAKLTAAQKRYISIGKWAVCLLFASFAWFIIWLLKKTSK